MTSSTIAAAAIIFSILLFGVCFAALGAAPVGADPAGQSQLSSLLVCELGCDDGRRSGGQSTSTMGLASAEMGNSSDGVSAGLALMKLLAFMHLIAHLTHTVRAAH